MPITTKRIINLDNAASVANDDYIVLDGTTNGTRKYATSGKGLSKNDYTDAEKTKLAGIAAGAEVNVQSDWSQSDNTADDYIKNKPTIPDLGDVLPQSSASGAIASFPDGSNLAKAVSIVADIDAVQSGSGTPSPNNVRPISGWNSVNVIARGANLWDEDWATGVWSPVNGAWVSDNTHVANKTKISVKAGNSYYVKSTAPIYVNQYDKDGAFISNIAGDSANKSITLANNAGFISFYCDSSYGTTYKNDISINYPATDTTYHAYNSDSATYTTSLGSTYYGGTLDVVSGVLTVTHGYVDLGTLTWTVYNADRCIYSAFVSDIKVYTDDAHTPPITCSQYATVLGDTTWVSGMVSQSSGMGAYVFVCDTDYTDAATFTTAMSGVQLVYELATPTTVQLTAQEVSILLGNNNVWCDSGDNVTVTYKADIKKYVDNAIATALA